MVMFEDLAWPKLPAAMNVDPTAALAAVRSRSPTLPKFPTLKTPRISLAAATAATKDLFQQSAAASSAATSAAKDLFQLQSAAAKNLLEERSAAAKDLIQQSAAPLLASSPVQQLVHQPVFSSVPVTSIFSALESVAPASLNQGTVPTVENVHDDESITLDDVSSRNQSIFESAVPSTEPAVLPSDCTSAPTPALPARVPLRIDTSVARFELAENSDGPAPATSATVVDAPASLVTVADAPAQVAEDVRLHEPEEPVPALDTSTQLAEDRSSVIPAEQAPEVVAPVETQPIVVEAPVEVDQADVGVPNQDELALVHALAQAEFAVADAPVQPTDRPDLDAPSPDDPATSLLADAPSVEPITDDVIPTSAQPDLEPITPPSEPEQDDRDSLVFEKPVFDDDAPTPVFDMAPAVAQLPTPVTSPHGSLVNDKPAARAVPKESASRRVSQLSSSSSRRSSRASKTSSMILQGHHELVSTWIEKPDGTRVLQRRIVLHDSPTSSTATAPAIAPAAEPTSDEEPALAAPSPRSSMDLRRASTVMPNVINVMAATMPPMTFLSGYQSSMPYDTTISPFAPPMLRRVSSESALTVTKAADAPKYPKDPRSIHALPAHRREACSPLAPEADLQSYRGLMNVAALTLVVSNLRLIIENFLSWGLLLTLPRNWVGTQDWVVGAACIAFLGCVAAFAYSIEKTSATAGACFFVIESPMRRWALINLIAALVVPTCFVWFAVRDPITGTAVMGLSVIVVLKLTSYHLVNAELRYFYNYGHNVPTYASKSDDDRAIYPRNITVANLVEFLSFPTLCYQPKYPRTDKVHVGKVIKYALETAAAVITMYTLVAQYMRPIVESTYAALTDPVTGAVHWTTPSPVLLLERTLTLTLTTIYFWLTMFFGTFHAASNLQAELTRFADREFYLDWWNCSTIGAYWRLWNQPVHTWLKRHVYIPLVAGKWLPDPHHPPGALPDSPRGEIVGVSKQTAGLVCFFVSAVFHELLIAVPTKLVWMVGFGAMIVQVPLMTVSEKWDKKYRQWKPDGVNMLGNLLMWVTFCLIGHPTAVMLYYVGWCAREHCVVALA
ncbi:hypothetical protein AMAG_08716 [Allomyces macrogynus ATCC 38327]|uniref:diacylglycerol O-acyltransferase n=1 Tax=Allomyces macrogynus (strain ATCC 38327) TaxID=578462 RepID=A0A0L0SMK6_ALLM3|nr:hypothetical protein AMAG_08716 [Allomyces macrogynus ATCC 38327]|eukprot:KNE63615.1 hypothetical protein AMAG_08716 [Allomyces macrogynus ATCC 38327]